MKLTAIEGTPQYLDGGAMFGHAPKELWKQWVSPDEKNRIPLACRSLLLQDQGKNILFDVGVGNFFPPKMRERYGVFENDHLLLTRLKEMGLNQEDIHAIILSHLHFDHAGGLLSPEGNLLFPKAAIYLGKAHWDSAQNPHPREQASFIPQLHTQLKNSERLHLIESSHHPALPRIAFRYSNGHTIGLMLSEIELPDQKVLFTSDLIAGIPWVHIPITMGYDRFAEKTVDEKKELLERCCKEKSILFFVHDFETAFAHVIQDEKGRFRGERISLQTLY